MLLETLRRRARALGLEGRCVLVAASGGVDSTVLAHGLQRLAAELSLELCLGHVNHGLRGAGSDADEAAVAELARKLGAAFRSRRVAPGRLRSGGSSRARPTLQEAARRLRYQALDSLAAELGATRIATAHTADDQAETLLLRLLRGTGPDGLGGIPERSPDGRVVRPLLPVSREEVLVYARREGLCWREDPGNRDPAYARSRLRTHWLPGLRREFNPQLLRAIGNLAEAQRRDSEWIASEVERAARERLRTEGAETCIVAGGWNELPEALARRVVRLALARSGAGRDVSRVHIERALAFLRGARPGKAIELPGGLVLVREREFFRLRRGFVTPPGAC